MAFSTIPSSLIQVGKATVKQLFDLIKGNLDDLDSRLTTVEASVSKFQFWSGPFYNASSGPSYTGVIGPFVVPSDFEITDAKIAIFLKGSLTGNLEIDVQKSTSQDFSSSVSVFTTKPKIDFSTASDYEASSNAALDNANKSFNAGDWYRIDITELPAGGVIGRFNIDIVGEAN